MAHDAGKALPQVFVNCRFQISETLVTFFGGLGRIYVSRLPDAPTEAARHLKMLFWSGEEFEKVYSPRKHRHLGALTRPLRLTKFVEVCPSYCRNDAWRNAEVDRSSSPVRPSAHEPIPDRWQTCARTSGSA
jgi:hypothetical protein